MRKLLNKSGKEGSLASNGSGSSLLGFALSLPPLLLVLGFVGIPILIGFTFSLGFTKGPNRIISIIGQQIHPKLIGGELLLPTPMSFMTHDSLAT